MNYERNALAYEYSRHGLEDDFLLEKDHSKKIMIVV